MGGDEIPNGDNRFPGSTISQRITVNLGEAVNRINPRVCISNPGDVVLVVVPEITALVEPDEFVNPGLLHIVFSYCGGLLEPIHNLLNRRAVHSADFPGSLE